MRKIGFIAVATLAITLVATATPSMAIGSFKWWTDNVTGNWLSQGIICWEKAADIAPGNKVVVSYKLGQSRTFVKLETVLGVPGDSLVDSDGNLLEEGAVDENGDLIEGTPACENGASDVAFVSTKLLTSPGSYIVRWGMYSKSGKFLWNEDEKVLNARKGADSGASFFTNPPNLYFNSYVSQNINPSIGVHAYTSKGKVRNACLVLYDLALAGMRSDFHARASDLIQSLQGGYFGVNVRSNIGSAGIPIALKCSPWIANYLW